MKSLSKFGFMDLYVHVDGDSPTRMRPTMKDRSLPPIVDVPPKYDEWNEGLKAAIKEKDANEFSLTYDGIRYRVNCSMTSTRQRWASLRKINTEIPHMSDLRIPQYIQKRLKFFAMNSGLIIVSGATGQGKTTTSTAMIGHYLENYGDVCISIEDPVEYDLQGQDWGPSAACYQFEVTEDAEWADYLKMALRWHPRYINIGELRTPEATAQALRAATSGHLVVTTLHAGTVQEALHALRQLAHPIAGERTDSLIADSFLAVTNQILKPSGPEMTILYTEGKGLGDPVRAGLRAGKLELLETTIEHQNMMRNAAPYP